MNSSSAHAKRIIEILKKLPVFAGLYIDEYEYIRSICIPCQFPQQHVIFRQGDASPCFYILLDGQLKVSTREKGLIYVLKSGEIFGEIGLIAQIKRTATVTTAQASTLIRINSADFKLLLGAQPRISALIMKNITLHLANHIVRMNRDAITDYLPNAS